MLEYLILEFHDQNYLSQIPGLQLKKLFVADITYQLVLNDSLL